MPPPPVPNSPLATPAALTGNGTVSVSDAGYTCGLPPCRGAWRVTCGGAGDPAFNLTGFRGQLSAGAGPSFSFDLIALARSGSQQYNCTAALTVLDAADQSGSSSVAFSVSSQPGLVWAIYAAGRACLTRCGVTVAIAQWAPADME